MADETITFSVPGMTCGHCVSAVETEVGRVAGVASVAADLDTKRVVVTGRGVRLEDLRSAVDDAGYELGD